jgi:hypothetical protein
MGHSKISIRYQLILLLLLACPKISLGNEFVVSAGTSLQSVDNPNNSTIEDQQFDETQWISSLNMIGQLDGNFARFVSDGTYEVRRYSQQEQQNIDLFIGTLNLDVGNETSRFLGSVSHTAEELLINTNLGDAPNNLDRRSITSAAGFLRFGSLSNRLSLVINAADAKYDISQINESSQVGGGILYDRAVSAASRFGVELSGYTLEYSDNTAASYDYRRAALSWQTTLRKLSYDFRLGGDSVDDGSDVSPFLEAVADYNTSFNRFSIAIRQFLTDTSQGAGSGPGLVGSNLAANVNINGQLGIIDQYTRREASVYWQNTSLCQRCTIGLGGGAQSESYRGDTTLDTTVGFAQSDFGYSVGRNISLDAAYELRQIGFDDDNRDYDLSRASAGITWQRILKRGTLRVFTELLESDPVNDLVGYKRTSYGLSFDYLLYERLDRP